MTEDDPTCYSAVDLEVWLTIMTALAGAEPPAEYACGDGHGAREKLKAHAWRLLEDAAEPKHAAFRAPAWVMWAFSHWARAVGAIDQWPGPVLEHVLPDGLSFRTYLSAWLYSVGIPQLSMTPADLLAVYAMTGAGPMPQTWLPLGTSVPRFEALPTTQVSRVPAKQLTVEALAKAMQPAGLG